MNNSIPTLLTGPIGARLFSSLLLLVIISQPVAAQAPVGNVDVSGGVRGQSANSSLQQLQEMDAVRREMSELRDLIERQGYEFNQYKRKSDQEILALREQLRMLQGGLGDGEDTSASGFSLGGVDGAAGAEEVPALINTVSETEAQAVPEILSPADQAPEEAMIGVSMGGYGQQSIPAVPASTPPAESGVTSVNAGYQQNTNNASTGASVPASNQPSGLPVTVEVVPAGGTPVVNQAPVTSGQAVTVENNSNISGTWQGQGTQNTQPNTAIANTADVGQRTQQQPVQNNNSELQWQVIQSPGPSSAPLDAAVTGSQIDQTVGAPTDSSSSQAQPSVDGVLGDL